MRALSRLRAIAAFLALSFMTTGCAALGLGENNVPNYTITADVPQAPNLFDGGRVMVRGVAVGRITDVEPLEDRVRLTMEIPETIQVPANARMTVVPITIIADRYVQLHPAYVVGPVMEDGDHIPLSRTAIPAELDEVITQLQSLLNSVKPKEGETGPLSKLITALDETFEGSSGDVSRTLDKSAAVLENLANSEDDLTSLIRNLDRLFITLANRSSEISLINERFLLVAKALAHDQEDIEGTIENVAFLANETSGLIEDSGDDIGETLDRLSRVVDSVLAHQNRLLLGIKWTNAIAQSLGAVDASGKGIYAYTGRQAKPGSPGAKYNYRIDQRDTIGCERINEVAKGLAAFGTITPADVLRALFLYLPEQYHEDLAFLLEELIVRCVDEFNGTTTSSTTLSPAEQRVIRRAGEIFGRKRVKRMVARWFAKGFLEGVE
jgi:virulence factor Mce-like protein